MERGVVPAGRSFDACVAAADYAVASDSVRNASPRRAGRPLVLLADLLSLHVLAVRRNVAAHPGEWRTTSGVPIASGIVPSPPWLVARDVTSYLGRFRDGPAPGSAPWLWLADAHRRFVRIHAFGEANGRVARLLLNLMLRRLALAPFVVVGARAMAAYRAALGKAAAGDVLALAATIERGVTRAARRLEATTTATDLAPLRSLVERADLSASYKAAERGRLVAVRVGGVLLTTPAWVAAYRASRGPGGRPRRP